MLEDGHIFSIRYDEKGGLQDIWLNDTLKKHRFYDIDSMALGDNHLVFTQRTSDQLYLVAVRAASWGLADEGKLLDHILPRELKFSAVEVGMPRPHFVLHPRRPLILVYGLHDLEVYSLNADANR